MGELFQYQDQIKIQRRYWISFINTKEIAWKLKIEEVCMQYGWEQGESVKIGMN